MKQWIKWTLPAVAVLLMTGCQSKYQTYSTVGQTGQNPDIGEIKNKNGSLSLYLKGGQYYGNLIFNPEQRFILNPLIQGIDGNAKGMLVSKEGKVISCVMELLPETQSGSGYCMEENNPKLLKINLVKMQ